MLRMHINWTYTVQSRNFLPYIPRSASYISTSRLPSTRLCAFALTAASYSRISLEGPPAAPSNPPISRSSCLTTADTKGRLYSSMYKLWDLLQKKFRYDESYNSCICVVIYTDTRKCNLYFLTSASHDFSRYLIGAAFWAENLAAHATVVSPSKGGESFAAFVALFTNTVWHPIASQLGIFVWT